MASVNSLSLRDCHRYCGSYISMEKTVCPELTCPNTTNATIIPLPVGSPVAVFQSIGNVTVQLLAWIGFLMLVYLAFDFFVGPTTTGGTKKPSPDENDDDKTPGQHRHESAPAGREGDKPPAGGAIGDCPYDHDAAENEMQLLRALIEQRDEELASEKAAATEKEKEMRKISEEKKWLEEDVARLTQERDEDAKTIFDLQMKLATPRQMNKAPTKKWKEFGGAEGLKERLRLSEKKLEKGRKEVEAAKEKYSSTSQAKENLWLNQTVTTLKDKLEAVQRLGYIDADFNLTTTRSKAEIEAAVEGLYQQGRQLQSQLTAATTAANERDSSGKATVSVDEANEVTNKLIAEAKSVIEQKEQELQSSQQTKKELEEKVSSKTNEVKNLDERITAMCLEAAPFVVNGKIDAVTKAEWDAQKNELDQSKGQLAHLQDVEARLAETAKKLKDLEHETEPLRDENGHLSGMSKADIDMKRAANEFGPGRPKPAEPPKAEPGVPQKKPEGSYRGIGVVSFAGVKPLGKKPKGSGGGGGSSYKNGGGSGDTPMATCAERSGGVGV